MIETDPLILPFLTTFIGKTMNSTSPFSPGRRLGRLHAEGAQRTKGRLRDAAQGADRGES